MTEIKAYFHGERIESFVFITFGLAAVVFGFYSMLVTNTDFSNGVAWPLIIVAFIQIAVGGFIYFRTPADLHRVLTFAKAGRKNIKNIEIPRMEMVMTKFKLYRYIEMGLVVFGLFIFLYASDGSFWRGVGFGLIIQSAIMLLADSFAENRGKNYLNFLKSSFK